MIHRGPDDAGCDIVCSDGLYFGFAHRRLSIIDLSPRGHQPMKTDDGNIEVVFNGEIYNYRELKKELFEYRFKSDSDTEVILAAYLKWGIHFVDRLNGMFAISLFDKKNGNLYLIRDRMGQKPLFYFMDEESIVYSSELKAIMQYPNIKLRINRKVLGRYLLKNCIASPDTIFLNTYKVNPGEIVEINGLSVKKHRYWDVNSVYKKKKNLYRKNYDTAQKDFESLMKSAVEYRLIADVPVGVLLSGGYDSSLVAALAQKCKKENINTYSIGMNDAKLNEAEYAKAVAKHLGSKHHEHYINVDEMLALVDQIPEYYDEPFADSSQIATMLVFEMAKKDNVKVILSGDGGDELFAGYPIYEDERIAQIIKPFANVLCKFFHGNRNKIGYAMSILSENNDRNTDTQFNYNSRIKSVRRMLPYSSGENYDESGISEKKWNIRRMLLDTQTYLPDDIHCKVDRASMKYSVEARSPFMDYRMVELALSMPHRYKQKGNKGKRLIKDVSWKMIPKELLDRPKSGFEVPIEKWLKNELRDDLVRVSRTEYIESQKIFDSIETPKMIDEYLLSDRSEFGNITMVIWSFYVFQLWYDRYKQYISEVDS